MNQPLKGSGSRGSGKNKEEIAEAYSSTPWWYDLRGFFILTFAYNSTLWSQVTFFGANFGKEHLEAALGTGTLTDIILKWRRWKKLPLSHVVGFDYADSMLAGARRRFRSNPQVELHHADAADLPFDDNRFDTVNIANAIHCLPEVDLALKEFFRVLKPGGELAANVLIYPRTPWPFNKIAEQINHWGIRKGILYRPYQAADIRQKLVDSGFEIMYEGVSGNCYDVKCRKP